MNWIIILLLIKDAFVMCGMCVLSYLCKDMTMPFWYALTIFGTLTAQATMILCELVILILEIIEEISICSLRRKKKKWVEEYERTHKGGIVQADDGFPINRCDAVIDEEKMRKLFNVK